MNYSKLRQFTYELPQSVLGLILKLFYKNSIQETMSYNDVEVILCRGFNGGISLGRYILLNAAYSQKAKKEVIKHEYGHCLQSRKLGWLYLLVIGLPSIIWAGLYGKVIKKTTNGYYKFYTEKWADKLGGVKR